MPIPDSTAGWLNGFNSGANVVGNALDRNIRVQELKSQEALRMIREREAAQSLAMKMQEFKREVDTNATLQKSLAAYGAMTQEEIMNPISGTIELNHARMDKPTAFRKLVVEPMAGLDAKFAMKLQDDFNNQQSREVTESRLAKSATTARPLAPENAALIKARTATEQAKLKEINARIEKGGAGWAPVDIQKKLDYFSKQGITLTPEQLKKIALISVGLEPRAGTEPTEPNRAAAVQRTFSQLRSLDNYAKLQDAEVLKKAEAIVDKILNDVEVGDTPQSPPPGGKKINVRSPDGKLGTIPEEDLEKALKRGYKIFDANSKG